MVWVDLIPHLAAFWQRVCDDLEPRQRAGRLKQWLNLMRRRFAEAERAYRRQFDALATQTLAGGVSWRAFQVASFRPTMQGSAQKLGSYEMALTASHDVSVAGQLRLGRITVSPFQDEGSIIAMASCQDLRGVVHTSAHGRVSRGFVRLHVAYFSRSRDGTLRMNSYAWYSVDACG